MDIEITEEAVEVLRRSLELGNVDPSTGGVRLRTARSSRRTACGCSSTRGLQTQSGTQC
jgi:hypothetical protein